jgi:PAS domain S-box-containing protein
VRRPSRRGLVSRNSQAGLIGHHDQLRLVADADVPAIERRCSLIGARPTTSTQLAEMRAIPSGPVGRPADEYPLNPVSAATPPTAPFCRLSATPESAGDARQFVATALEGLDEDVVYTAQLVTTELVTNAILHAGSELEVRAWATRGRVHVRVFDREPARSLVPRQMTADAETGRGLHLVEALSAAYGVESSADGKAVWFELWPDVAAETHAGSDWSMPISEEGDRATVRLLDVPIGLCRAAQRHRAALLREGRLALLLDRDSIEVELDDLVATARLNDALDAALNTAFAGASPAEGSVTCDVELPVHWSPLAVSLLQVLEALNNAARAGRLLTRPALPEVRRFRRWLLDEVTIQLGGGSPSPWTAEQDQQGESASLELYWDDADVRASSAPAVAADDDNRIVAVNTAAAELLGWNAEDLVGRRITALIPPAWRERHVSGFTNFLLTGESKLVGSTVRVPALHKDGDTITVELAITVKPSRQGRTIFVAELRPAG